MTWWRRLVFVALVAAGAVVTAWPVAETLQQDSRTREAAREYTRTSYGAVDASGSRVGSDPAARDLVAAQHYNATLPAHLLDDPWGATPGDVSGAAHDAYLRLLARGPVMARVQVPRLDVDLPVVHDTDAASLRRGAGHMYGSSLPVGGTGTHAVLAAHTGSWRATFFDRLDEARVGDAVAVEVAGQRLDYLIDDIAVVHAEQLARVRAVPGRDLLTLVTCITPQGHDKQRLLVRASRVPGAAQVAVPGSERAGGFLLPPVQRWMWPRLAVAAAAALLVAGCVTRWIVVYARARRTAGRTDRAVSA